MKLQSGKIQEILRLAPCGTPVIPHALFNLTIKNSIYSSFLIQGSLTIYCYIIAYCIPGQGAQNHQFLGKKTEGVCLVLLFF